MDPDAALAGARQAAQMLTAELDKEAPAYVDVVAEEAERLATSFAALDTWMSGGGFLPRAWQHPDRPA